jgi:hypothetical protein
MPEHSQTDWMTKCIFAFVIGCFCLIQSSPFQSLCNGPSISATAGSTTGTDLELCVGHSGIFCEFQGCSGNIACVNVISFSEAKKLQWVRSGV